jgi:hypothetical protein
MTLTCMQHPTELPALAFAIGIAVAASASMAHAQSTSAHAGNLFKEGRRLLQQKQYEEACPKLAESARLDPGSGTLGSLGQCYEGQHKYASAWGAYVEAAAAARRDQRHDWLNDANHKAVELEKKVSRVTFEVTSTLSSLKGFMLKLDGASLGNAAWTSVPVDGGEHEIEISAPGKKGASMKFTVGAESERKQIQVPKLEDLPLPPPEPPVVAGTGVSPQGPVGHPGSSLASGQRIAGVVSLGVGVVSLGVGTFFGIKAIRTAGEVKDACSTPQCADAATVQMNNEARTAADVSTITIGAGAALAISGLVLVLTAPSSTPKTMQVVSVTPSLGSNGTGITIGGIF